MAYVQVEVDEVSVGVAYLVLTYLFYSNVSRKDQMVFSSNVWVLLISPMLTSKHLESISDC
jgi:hypothetical protein